MNTTEFSLITNELLIASMPGHVYWLDINNVYQGANDQQAKAFGLQSRHEIVGKKNTDFKIIDKKIAKLWDQNNLAVMQSGKARIIEEPSILSNGKMVMVISHKTPLFTAEGEVQGLLGISLDMSEWKEKETNLLQQKIIEANLSLEHIIMHLPGHVYWKNVDGIYLCCNEQQAKTCGFKFRQEVIGKTDLDLLLLHSKLEDALEQEEIIRQNDRRIMESGKSETIEEIVYINGKKLTFLSQKSQLKDQDGKVIGILGISFDISKQKQLELSLIEAKEAAELANRFKSEFIQNMEHDIRTPFSGILGIANILETNEIDLHKKEMLADIAACAQELLNYTCSILDFSQIESSTLSLMPKKFFLKEVIDSLYNIELPIAQTKGLEFSVYIEPEIHPQLIGDEYRLKRILINLLSNSIKFTHQGFVRLKVLLVSVVNDTIVLNFMVEDSGIGIAEDSINNLYEKFNRLTPANIGIYKGQGLGLRIVKQFVMEMSGKIAINSILGNGVSFTCTLPFRLPAY